MVESVETPTTTSRRSILCEHSLLQDRKHKKICPWWCIWPKSYTFVFLQFLVGLHSSVAGVKYGGNNSLVRLSYWLWSGIFHEIAIINTTFAQTLRGEGKKQKKKEMCMWSGRNKAWNVSCNLASHGYPSPNTSENMKPQCHNENSFV